MSSLAGKRALVTGACGFIGSHLVEHLVRDHGAKVRALVYYNSFGSQGWLEDLSPEIRQQIEVVAGDVRDEAWVRSVVKDQQVVFHLAALVAIPYSYIAPAAYVQTNVLGTLNVLSAARDLGVERLVHTSTSEVYGTALTVPIPETHPLQGQSPYSATKIGADKLVESFHLSFGIPAVTLRPFNTFGPRQSMRAVIPTVISQILAGKKSIELGSITPTRDFTFVGDTVAAFAAAGSTPGIEGEVMNAGNGKEISVGDLVRKIGEVLGSPVDVRSVEERVRPANSEVNRLLAKTERIFEKTGWRPQVSLSEGIRRTAEWIKNRPRYLRDADIYHV